MAIKFSFMTWVCPHWDLSRIIEAANKYRYHGVELRTEVGHAHGIEPESDDATIKLAKGLFESNGIEVSAIATSCSFSHADASKRREMVERSKKHIELAAKLGCTNVRVFGGAIPDGVSMEDAKRYIADALRELGEFAQPMSVYVLLETHDAFSRSKDAVEVVRLASHPNVRILWDVQHPYTHGETLDEAFENVRNFVRHCHIHDVRRTDSGWELCLLGEGEISHEFVIRKLHEIDFDGHLSGEFINSPWEPDFILKQYADKLYHYLERLG
ncbi:MAG: sugar phosphate isomerase/epimerase family protein [Armatimonadota bacterium]|nr:sugar phosphate isomerase/epimerase [Armatimonadota bacterium]MCX7776781.1 sugar phosphate isomerase/epimerase [Armatimonadota bacterium]MDW8024578.1 sugar phosphate isomerase/epimerase family protein [Armatimonadota bacterium]